jgi:cytochrome c-type biogenesis protein CcmH
MRDELTAAVTRGDSDNNVLQWFIQTYGTTVLTVPTDHGFNRIAWIMPYLALVLGIGLVVFIVAVWKKRPLTAHANVPTAVRGLELDRFRDQARRETQL